MEITPGPWQAQREGLDFWQEFFRPVEPPRRESRPPAGRIEGAEDGRRGRGEGAAGEGRSRGKEKPGAAGAASR